MGFHQQHQHNYLFAVTAFESQKAFLTAFAFLVNYSSLVIIRLFAEIVPTSWSYPEETVECSCHESQTNQPWTMAASFQSHYTSWRDARVIADCLQTACIHLLSHYWINWLRSCSTADDLSQKNCYRPYMQDPFAWEREQASPPNTASRDCSRSRCERLRMKNWGLSNL